MKLQARSVFGPMFGVATRVPELSTTLRERADIGCLLVNSAVESAAVASKLNAAVRAEFPLKASAIPDMVCRRVLWLTPRAWLLHCEVEEEWALAKKINEAFPDKRVHAALFSDYLCWFEFFGPRACDLLSEGGFVSLERDGLSPRHYKRTALAGIPAVIVREEPETWLIGIERSRAVYFTNWVRAVVTTRCSRLGGR